MASILRRKTGSVAVQFVDVNGTRRTLALGANPPERFINRSAEVVDDLLAAASYGTPVDADVLAWLDGLKDDQHSRFVDAGLVHSREKREAAETTVAQFAETYLAKRSDVKYSTRLVLKNVVRNLTAFFGKTRLVDVTAGDADDFARWLMAEGRSAEQVESKGTALAPATCGKRLQLAGTIFGDARKRRLIADNPFDDVRKPGSTNSERLAYVPAETIERLIELDPNPEWRLLLALARYQGLRTPSEPFSLTWDCVDWERRRLKVISPKTAGTGKAFRMVPILPEVMPHLERVFDAAPKGAVYILDGLRQRDSMAAADRGDWGAVNLRTRLEKKLKRAGIGQWPRLWHALRASAETDLAGRFPLHTVTAWIGHTPQIAERHYLMVRDEEFDRAASESALHGALHGTPKPTVLERNSELKNAKTPVKTGVFVSLAGRSGTRTHPEKCEKTGLPVRAQPNALLAPLETR